MICIVGGGISGLFTCWNLIKLGLNPIIIEKQKIGGKISSEKILENVVEYGPSVIHLNQKNIINLCLDLKIQIEEIPKGSFFSFLKNPIEIKNLNYYEKSIKVKDVLNSNNILNFYETEHMLLNDLIDTVKNEGEWVIPKKGFSFIIKKLQQKLKNNIIFDEVTHIQNTKNNIKITVASQKHFFVNSVIICTTMSQMNKIFINNKNNLGKGLTKRMESCRIYIFLNKNSSEINPIFKNRVIYRKESGLAIKISERILLISYTDGSNIDKETLKDTLVFYKIDTKYIDNVKKILYTDAYDLAISTVDLNLQLDKNIYQSCFPDRKNQTWLEGNLIQCRKIIDTFYKDIK